MRPLRGFNAVLFENDEQGYLDWVDTHSGGYVVNAEIGRYFKLHRAECPHIGAKVTRVSTHFTDHRFVKVCSDDCAELERYIKLQPYSHRRHPCQHCFEGAQETATKLAASGTLSRGRRRVATQGSDFSDGKSERRPATMEEFREAYSYLVDSGRRTVLPAHQHYQVALKQFLLSRGVSPEFERDFADVRFSIAGRMFVGEIKVTTYLSVAEAFRAALGQILDYTHVASEKFATSIIFLDQQLDRRRIELATKLGIAIVVRQGETHKILNGGVAPLLRDIFT